MTQCKAEREARDGTVWFCLVEAEPETHEIHHDETGTQWQK